jgi:hypothetical protein
MQESISELSSTIGYGITNFAATNLKGTNLPAPSPAAPPSAQHKTLPHALNRSAAAAANALRASNPQTEDKLAKALGAYAKVWDKIAAARLQQDASIQSGFLQPWQQTLSTSIAVAMRARQAVRVSRLELDAAKQSYVHPRTGYNLRTNEALHSLKNAGPSKQEHSRLEVENAEDDLVQKTEVAITLMKTVLDNVLRFLPHRTTSILIRLYHHSLNPSRISMSLRRHR